VTLLEVEERFVTVETADELTDVFRGQLERARHGDSSRPEEFKRSATRFSSNEPLLLTLSRIDLRR